VIARRVQLALSVLALSAIAGCGPHFDHLDFIERTTPPMTVSLLSTGVSIPEGIAVAFTPLAMDGSTRMEDAQVDLVTSDDGVLGLDRAEDEGFVMYGVHPGHANISIFVDGEAVGTLPASVTPQL